LGESLELDVEMMTEPNSFTTAHVDSAGLARGIDERGHSLFKVVRGVGPTLYGSYFYIFDSTGFNFNIEVRLFGYFKTNAMGDLDPTLREHLSPEEASAAE
jgi:hypothetical protein